MRQYGFVRAAAAVPVTVPGGVDRNIAAIISLSREAASRGAEIAVFPEMAVTGYTCGDLFAQKRLLDRTLEGLLELESFTAAEPELPLLAVGAPLRAGGVLFNCAVLIRSGRILGIVPKTYLPSTHEFYESRWFSPGITARETGLTGLNLAGRSIPFGIDLLFSSGARPELTLGVEICEDLWAPLPPSIRQSLAGARIILNPSASNDLAGKAFYRRELVVQQSARCLAGYVYASCGPGESSTDTVFGGDALIAENGRLLARGDRFVRTGSLLLADLDPEYLDHERSTSTSFGQTIRQEGSLGGLEFRRILWEESGAGEKPGEQTSAEVLLRPVDPRPFVPADDHLRAERCEEIFSIQSSGLATRLEHTGCRKAVLGLSGGLDSTLALLVTVQAFDLLGLDRRGILCMTMPGFGTTGRTRGNAEKLADLLGVTLETVDIRRGSTVQLEDLSHSGEPSDTAYENVQARMRTALLMNRSNMVGGMVIGTGDLSELALGWCTYNGDHMSMYAVNTGVPKTLVRYLVQYVADSREDAETAAVLMDIIDTPISPELLPPDREGKIQQKTEDTIGPYELHDFFLFQAVRCGFAPAKVFFLAVQAFCSGEKPAYRPETVLRWLEVFYRRFFSQQFKRSCLPDGPKVGTLALSPRGDWRMPSDASPEVWLAEIETIRKRMES